MADPPSLRPIVLDLSHHNEIRDWQALRRAGIRGVILKCSQGRTYVDPTYAKRKDEARAAGLLVGAYHFCTSADPITQMEFFVQQAEVDSSLLLALDWEHYSDGEGTQVMSVPAFRKAIDHLAEITGRTREHIVIYSGDVVKSYVTTEEDIAHLSACRLWLAEYGPRAVLPKGWPVGYWLWQFSEKYDPLALGKGVTGLVDANRFGGDNLEAEWAPGYAIAASDPILVETVERAQAPAQAELVPAPSIPSGIAMPAPPPNMVPSAAPHPSPEVIEETPSAPPPAAPQAVFRDPPKTVTLISHTPPPEEAPPMQAKADWSNWSFVRINELAEQGSRLAQNIRNVKQMFWKGSGAIGGTSIAGAAFLDPTQGTGGAIHNMAAAHPFLLLFLGMGLTALCFYVGVLVIERYTLTAHTDGRYMTRAQVGQ